MELWTLIFCVIPALATAIMVSSNGNSPEMKMVGGMMVGLRQGFLPMTPKLIESTMKTNHVKMRLSNVTKLSINERYRRLIPYMTFYYANDLVSSTTEGSAMDIEVEKAEIVEAKTITHTNKRQPKKNVYTSSRDIPVYQGNRLTQYNIASANPSNFFYKEVASSPTGNNFKNTNYNYNPLFVDHRSLTNSDYERIRKPTLKAPSVPFAPPTRKPYIHFYETNVPETIKYYTPEREQNPKYKLVPYEQTPPLKLLSQNERYVYDTPQTLTRVPVHIPKESVYIGQGPARPQYVYENVNTPQSDSIRKPPSIVSESYYEERRPISPIVIESGFKPIINPIQSTEAPIYENSLPATPVPDNESEKHQIEIPTQGSALDGYKSNYYQYVVEQPTYKPPVQAESNTITLADLLNSLQLNKSIPKPITKENVGASIRTLLQVLNALKEFPDNEAEAPALSTPKPLIENNIVTETPKPAEVTSVTEQPDLHEEPIAPINTPSQFLDDYPSGTSQRFPQPVNSDDEGGTPGRPGVDYPVLSTIPPTAFNCKTQRYKGFFADPETRCQVWHYCDLNGGQASFLCPNGTIFSQAALTCDWWFNVRCASTTQLYVLNESLYKYILPHSPKFPEDYSGPLVDKYLTLKFKEMEEQFKKNKNKQSASDKMDEEEEEKMTQDSSNESSSESAEQELTEKAAVSEASVIVESQGTSGNVERLQD